MTCESSRIALAPASGSRPACALLPMTSISNLPPPLRAVLSLPSGTKCRLEHECPRGAAGEHLDVPARLAASLLLIGVHEGDGWHFGRDVQLSKRSERENHLREAALHVVDAGTTDQRRPVTSTGISLSVADRPNRIAVAEQKLERTPAASVSRPAAYSRQELATGRPSRKPPHLETRGLEPLAQEAHHRFLGGRIVGRRFREGEAAYVVDELFPMASRPLQQPASKLGGHAATNA